MYRYCPAGKKFNMKRYFLTETAINGYFDNKRKPASAAQVNTPDTSIITGRMKTAAGKRKPED